MCKRSLSIAVAASATLVLFGCGMEPDVSFKNDLRPVLDKHCAECHTGNAEGVEASGFLVETYESVMKGTKLGPVVVAGDPLSSNLYRLVAGKVDKSIQMPHGKAPLTGDEIRVVELWIEQGANNN